MANNKAIRLTESQLSGIIKEVTLDLLGSKVLLNEMPYKRADLLVLADAQARNAYKHIAKLLLYRNSTNDANKWANDIVNNFTLPVLKAKVDIKKDAWVKLMTQCYKTNFFGENFEDYNDAMREFCEEAIRDMEFNATKFRQKAPQHYEIDAMLIQGQGIVRNYAQTVIDVVRGKNKQDPHTVLQMSLRESLNTVLGLDL